VRGRQKASRFLQAEREAFIREAACERVSVIVVSPEP
jgi:hypothetical protein